MAEQGWQRLLAGYPWFEGEGKYPITAYSEFMPPPRLGRKPYGSIDHCLCREDDPFGWHVTEYEESLELQPGLAMIAKELMHVVHHLGCCDPAHGIARKKLDGNPYCPDDLVISGAPRTNATCSCSRCRFPRPRTIKAASAGRCSAAASKAPPGPSGRAFIRPPAAKCRGSGPRASSAAYSARLTMRSRKP